VRDEGKKGDGTAGDLDIRLGSSGYREIRRETI
jgi:hypothetical protein